MSNMKAILAKHRGARDTWKGSMQKMFERVIRDLEEIKKQALQTEQSYRDKISKGTVKGLERARARGIKLGGARRKSKINLNQLRALHRSGRTQEEIADVLDCSQGLVSRLLRAKKIKAQMRRKK
jgi:DNA invertase Pin-like site-specific DNA recombinase